LHDRFRRQSSTLRRLLCWRQQRHSVLGTKKKQKSFLPWAMSPRPYCRTEGNLLSLPHLDKFHHRRIISGFKDRRRQPAWGFDLAKPVPRSTDHVAVRAKIAPAPIRRNSGQTAEADAASQLEFKFQFWLPVNFGRDC